MRKNSLPTNIDQFNKSNVFIEVNSPNWRNANKISIEDLLDNILTFDISNAIDNKTIQVDPDTLKIKVVNANQSNVYHEHFDDAIISINRPPKNASEITGLHVVSDQNYLYIWVVNRWKRIPLQEW